MTLHSKYSILWIILVGMCLWGFSLLFGSSCISFILLMIPCNERIFSFLLLIDIWIFANLQTWIVCYEPTYTLTDFSIKIHDISWIRTFVYIWHKYHCLVFVFSWYHFSLDLKFLSPNFRCLLVCRLMGFGKRLDQVGLWPGMWWSVWVD